MKTVYDGFDSPIGVIHVVVDEKGVCGIFLREDHWGEYIAQHMETVRDKKLCSSAIKQLQEYFSGERKSFDLPLSIEGTDFCKTVWKALQTVPYGETRSYRDIAENIGKPKACRAIGQANRKNPVPIIIPCHRVNGTNGELTGYMGSYIDIKRQLLEIEKAYSAKDGKQEEAW